MGRVRLLRFFLYLAMFVAVLQTLGAALEFLGGGNFVASAVFAISPGLRRPSRHRRTAES